MCGVGAHDLSIPRLQLTTDPSCSQAWGRGSASWGRPLLADGAHSPKLIERHKAATTPALLPLPFYPGSLQAERLAKQQECPVWVLARLPRHRTVLSPPDQGTLPSEAIGPLAHPGPQTQAGDSQQGRPGVLGTTHGVARGPRRSQPGPGFTEAPPPSWTEPGPLTVGSVWTETMSSGLTSGGSSEGGARPGSFCLEGKECLRQSPPQLVQGSAGSQKGPPRRGPTAGS